MLSAHLHTSWDSSTRVCSFQLNAPGPLEALNKGLLH